MNQESPRDEYTPAAVEACEKALRTIVTHIGPWGEQFVLLGGLVPSYLIPELPDGIEPHVGTTDLDIVLGVAMAKDADEAYRTLQKNLQDAGFAPARSPETGVELSYAWQRIVDGVPVTLEFFCPVQEGGEPGRLRRNPAAGVGSRISAIQLRGAELAGRDASAIVLRGPTLDEGGDREVTVHVAGLLPFLTLKAFALTERVKEKDAYDIVWTVTAFGEGPRDAARTAKNSIVAAEPTVSDGILALTEAFAELGATGPSLYARFFLGVIEAPERRQTLRRYAYGALQEFLAEWNRPTDG